MWQGLVLEKAEVVVDNCTIIHNSFAGAPSYKYDCTTIHNSFATIAGNRNTIHACWRVIKTACKTIAQKCTTTLIDDYQAIGTLNKRTQDACTHACTNARTHERMHGLTHARTDARTHARTKYDMRLQSINPKLMKEAHAPTGCCSISNLFA